VYDPIPWHIDEIEAARRGLRGAGWYMIGDEGEPIVGPHEDPEACIVEIGDRVRGAAAPRPVCVIG
jgi:hypothetical protein